MALSAYVLPQVIVYQEFANQPAAIAQTQLACIVGPQYDLHRYAVAAEKDGTLVSSTYDPANQTCFGWPSLTPGNVVDEGYTEVTMENALLQYFYDPAGDASVEKWVGPNKNRFRAASQIFQTANGYSRSASLLRDVQAGDTVKLLASACGSPITVIANVIGLVADELVAIVEPATHDPNNKAPTTASATGSQTAGTLNEVEITSVNGASYDGLAAGYPSEVYTVTVIGGGAGGVGSSAILSVTSASGTDNQAAITPANFGSPTDIGTRGLKVTFDNSGASSSPDIDQVDFLIGQTFVFRVSQLFVPCSAASSGVYNGATDTTYIVTVTTGGLFAAKPQITVSTTTGVDISGPTQVLVSAGAVVVGTQGVQIAFTGAQGLCTGDRYYIPVTAKQPGAVRTIILDRNLPEGMRGECEVGSSSSSEPGGPPDLDVTIYINKTIQVPQDRQGYAPLVNWTQTATEICLEPGIIAYDASWQVGGILQPLPVMNGTVYITHRDLVLANSHAVGTVSSTSATPAGIVDPDNPLAYGIYKALQNSNGQAVKYVAVNGGVTGPALADWNTALGLLVGRNDVYGLVPLTQDKAVGQAFQAHVDSQSSPTKGRWRCCWLNQVLPSTLPIYTKDSSGHPLLATISLSSGVPGTQYTTLESPGANFITQGVRVGDIVRTLYTSDGFGNQSYSEFAIQSILNQETLLLATGPSSPVTVPSKFEVWRNPNADALATEAATFPGVYSDRRVKLVWPDVVGDAGVTMPGYFLCAALAGLRSGVLPHQGLTNVEVKGFDDLSRTTQFFTSDQLDVLAASGYWIVTQDTNTGTVYTRQQLTTGDQSDINMREDSVTSNMDNLSYNFLQIMAPYIGRGNVTPTMIKLLQGDLIGMIAQFKNTIASNTLGPQIITGQIVSLAPDTVYRDRIDCTINITLPYPLNNLVLYLVAV